MQNLAFVVIPVIGSLLIIVLLYSILVFGQHFGKLAFTGNACLLLIFSVFYVVLLDTGSKPIPITRKFLHNLKENLRANKRKQETHWFRLFLRSCQPISLNMGPLHKLDRGRGPAMIRFCLQRTIFLVVKNKTSQ